MSHGDRGWVWVGEETEGQGLAGLRVGRGVLQPKDVWSAVRLSHLLYGGGR